MILPVVVIFTALVIFFIFVFSCFEKIISSVQTPVIFRQLTNSKSTASVRSVILNQDDNNTNQENTEREALFENEVSLNQSQNADQILQLHSMPSQNTFAPQEIPLTLLEASNSNINQDEFAKATPTSTKGYPYVSGHKQQENPPSYNEIENFHSAPSVASNETILYNSGKADTKV